MSITEKPIWNIFPSNSNENISQPMFIDPNSRKLRVIKKIIKPITLLSRNECFRQYFILSTKLEILCYIHISIEIFPLHIKICSRNHIVGILLCRPDSLDKIFKY